MEKKKQPVEVAWTAQSSLGCVSYYHQEYIPAKEHYFECKLSYRHPVFCSHCHTKITVDRHGELKYEHSDKLLMAQLRRELDHK